MTIPFLSLPSLPFRNVNFASGDAYCRECLKFKCPGWAAGVCVGINVYVVSVGMSPDDVLYVWKEKAVFSFS